MNKLNFEMEESKVDESQSRVGNDETKHFSDSKFPDVRQF